MKATFAVGDAVAVQSVKPTGHCRVPGYLRGKRGRIVAVVGSYPLADKRARSEQSEPEPLYTVMFYAADVWGGGDVQLSIAADLWESYLEVPR